MAFEMGKLYPILACDPLPCVVIFGLACPRLKLLWNRNRGISLLCTIAFLKVSSHKLAQYPTGCNHTR
jgi:hypothetical protein